MITFLLFLAKAKAFIGGLFTFAFTHWKVVFPIIAIGFLSLYGWNKYQGEVKGRVAAEQALTAHQKEVKDAKVKRDADNLINSKLAQKKIDAEREKNKQDILAIIAKGKSNEANLKKNEVVNDRTINNYRDSLRLAIEREAALRLSRDDSNRSTGTDSHTAISRSVQEAEAELEVCKEAGAVAAADYNFCRAYVKSEQSILGVRP